MTRTAFVFFCLFAATLALGMRLQGDETSDAAQLAAAAAQITGAAPATNSPATPTPVTNSSVEEIIIVYKTHFDIGYTRLAREVIAKYRTSMIDHALEVVDQNRNLPPDQQFTWTIPGWPMKKILEDWPGQTAERKQNILRAFQDGRFVTHALPFTMQTDMIEPEDLVRGLGFASRLARDAGHPLPRSAKMTDVPCHSWILPTLLTHAGVNFLHLGCNPASSSPQVPALFWWEGPDGSRLLTMYSAGGYGSSLLPPPDWPHKTWLALTMTSDNQGPPRPGQVKQMIDQVAKTLPGVKVRVGQLSDFADRLIAEKPDLPVVRGDMPDTWIHGPMCDPAGAILARHIDSDIGAAESLATLLKVWNVNTPNPFAAIADAYENNLLYYEHTWGGALGWIMRYLGPGETGTGASDDWAYGDKWKADLAAGRFTRLQESWDEHSNYISTARDVIAPVLDGELKKLANATGGSGTRIVVYNPLPWQRDGMVAVKLRGDAIAALQPTDGGPAIAATADADAVRFLARDIPPLGYRVYAPAKRETPAPTDADAGTLENRWLKVTLDPATGTIRSLLEKGTGRELVDATASHQFGQYLYERFDADRVASFVKSYVKGKQAWGFVEFGKPNMPPSSQVPYRAASPFNCKLTMEQSAVSSAGVMQSTPDADLPQSVSTRVILAADAPYVDIEVTVEKQADAWPEAGWICLPFKVQEPRFRVGRAGSVIDPAGDIVPGANRHLYAVSTGVAVFDAQGRGAAVCSPDAPLVSLGEPGCWKFSTDYVPQKPIVYFNLFNNQWSTNYRLWNSGKWTFRVRVWAFDHYQAEPDLITPSLEARHPLLAAMTDGSGGKLPASQAGLALSRKGVQVTAFGKNPDGVGTILRVWELSGASGPLTVTLPKGAGFSKATPVDLRGENPGLPLVIEGGRFTLGLGAYAPATVVLE
jgi:alpha-mannosidase